MKLKSTLALAFALTLCAGVCHSLWADDGTAAQGTDNGADQQRQIQAQDQAQGQSKDEGRTTASVHPKETLSMSDDAGNADSDLAKAENDVQHHDASLQPSYRGTNFH
jgi:hypothetical protein